MKKLILYLFLLFNTSIAFGAGTTYYVATDGSDAEGDGTSGNPWLTIQNGIDNMASGDILIVGDGTYVGADNILSGIPQGSSTSYTTVRAETDFGVTIATPTTPVCVLTSSYVVVQGFKFYNNPDGNVCQMSGNYTKVIRCASNGGYMEHSQFEAGGNYNLFEECFAFGQMRYGFVSNGANCNYTIWRRCVGRSDYYLATNPYSIFANYDRPNIEFQNCIAIDGLDNNLHRGGANDGLKSFFTPNGADQTQFVGCIALNTEGAAYWLEGQPISSVTVQNCIGWKIIDNGQSASEDYDAYALYSQSDADGGFVSVDHCTFGDKDWNDNGIVLTQNIPNDSITNCIVSSFTETTGKVALISVSVSTVSYIRYFGNTSGRNQNSAYGVGTSSMVDVYVSSLKYLPRIEEDSELSGVASDSGDIGATVLKKIGTSGTLWGEDGWNTATSDNLWPFPNEGVIKTEMGSVSWDEGVVWSTAPAINGARGFCSSEKRLDGVSDITLTSYIWEFLGNQIPSDIYGEEVVESLFIKRLGINNYKSIGFRKWK